jgi:hypothetical protein
MTPELLKSRRVLPRADGDKGRICLVGVFCFYPLRRQRSSGYAKLVHSPFVEVTSRGERSNNRATRGIRKWISEGSEGFQGGLDSVLEKLHGSCGKVHHHAHMRPRVGHKWVVFVSPTGVVILVRRAMARLRFHVVEVK